MPLAGPTSHGEGGSCLFITAGTRERHSPASEVQVLSMECQQGSSRRLQRPWEVSLVVTRAGQ